LWDLSTSTSRDYAAARVTPIAVLGGTGPEGLGLSMRLAAAGEAVVVGSRALERAIEAAGRVRKAVPEARVDGAENLDALARAEIVVLTLPFAGIGPFLDVAAARLAGKLVIDVVVPLMFDAGFCDVMPIPGAASAGELIQQRAPEARVVSTFKNLPATCLQALPAPVEGDCLLCGDDARARSEVAALVSRIRSLRPIDAGGLRVARHLEALTALQINLNRRHRAETSVIIHGLPPSV
jgi:hypothetical protein